MRSNDNQDSTKTLAAATEVRPVLITSIFGKHVPTLFDSGANINIINFRTYKELPASRRHPIIPTDRGIRTANNEKLVIFGRTKLSLHIGDITINCTAYVVPGICNDMIIGAATMKENDILLNIPNKSLLQKTPVSKKPHALIVAKKITIPPRTEVGIKMTSKEPLTGKLVLIEDDTEILQPCVMTIPDEPVFRILAQNPHDLPISFNRGDTLGEASLANQTNGFEIMNDFANLTEETRRILVEDEPELTEQDINLRGIPTQWRSRYLGILNKYRGTVITRNSVNIGCSTAVKQHITLTDPTMIVNTPPYRTPHHLVPVVHSYVRSLLDQKVIQHSTSPFNSPLMIVKKAGYDPEKPVGANFRIVHDYRKLNNITLKDSYPMQNLYALLDSVAAAPILSVIDLSQAFFQQALTEDSRPKTAFSVQGMGHYEYLRSAQGLTNSPAAFQRLLDYVTSGLDHVHCYIDDIILASGTYGDHAQQLDKLLARLKENNLKIRCEKIQIGTPTVTYLGYEISSSGIRPGTAKTLAIVKWPAPESVKEVRQFLGLTSFFRRTIPNFAEIANPLTRLTRKDSTWKGGKLSNEARQAFQRLKEKLAKRPCPLQ